jgi:DNA-binding NtrC family response regulator
MHMTLAKSSSAAGGQGQTILVVDDDPVQRRLMEAALTRIGYEPMMAASGAEGLAALSGSEGKIAAVLLDLFMPDMGGLDVLGRMRDGGIDTPAIVLTSNGGMETVISAMRAGAFDFLVKPVSPERLKAALANAIKVEGHAAGPRQARRQPAAAFSFHDMIAQTPAMERVLRLGRKAAGSDIPILIEGESGSGKEVIARAIQAASDRKSKPFITVNCGAIPDNLVESILFGHEKGAFTGATEKHPGKFVEANGGTLFLDEIGDLPLDVQVKLLRAVQEGEVETVGGRGVQKVDIRLISATHRDLLQRVKDGLFREDLYYRLNVFPIQVPSLRQRPDDIPALVAHFIARLAKRERSPISGISPKALSMLMAYDWPGNIRQLENAVFRAFVLADGALLDVDDFPQIRLELENENGEADWADIEAAGHEFSAPSTVQLADHGPTIAGQVSEPLPSSRLNALDVSGNVRALADIELEMILFAVDHYGGQMSEVARRLGIGRSTLYRKFKEYGIDPDSGRLMAENVTAF